MPTGCSAPLFEFARVESRAVVASFDGGRMTSDAGALLLGAADRVVGLTRRLASCFSDARDPSLIEHEVETLVMQRVVGIARLRGPARPRHAAPRSGAGDAGRQALGTAPPGPCAAGRQIDAEPAGTEPR